MKKRIGLVLLGIIVITSLLFGACTPQATQTTAPTSAPAQPEATQPPAQPEATTAPVQPTTAPVVDDKSGGRVVVMDASGFYTLDPYQTPWFTLTQGAIYDALLTTDLNLEFAGVLATSWEVASDNLSITFKLRDDVTFHDGTPFNAEAAKWNFDKYLDPEWPHSINGAWVDYIEEFQAVDDTTLVVKLIKPYAPIFSDLALTYIVSPTAYETLGQDNFGREPVGTGPWIAKEIVENDHVLYERNPDYKWAPAHFENQGPVYPDELMIRFITDEAVHYASLETGEATIISLPSQFIETAQGNSNFKINQGISWDDWYLGFNNSIAPFTDLDFRKAVSHAINREEIIEVGYGGNAYALHSSLPYSTWGFQESQNEAGKAADPFDQDKSMELLAGLGYADSNGDGILEKDGEELTLTLTFPPSEDIKRVAETIQGQLLEVGINLELNPMEAAAVSQLLMSCEQEMFLRPFGLQDASILSMVFHSATMNSSNRNCWADPQADELINTADSLMDPDVRRDAVNDLVMYLIEQRPHVPLWSSLIYTAYRAELQDLKFDKAGGFFLMDAYFEK